MSYRETLLLACAVLGVVALGVLLLVGNVLLGMSLSPLLLIVSVPASLFLFAVALAGLIHRTA